MQTVKVEAHRMEEDKKAAKAKCKDDEQERNQLKNELEELRATSKAQRKEHEELQAGFTGRKKELKINFQKQVDEMFFFSYRC